MKNNEMEVYKATGKTKTGEDLRITKPIGALVIKADLGLNDLTNESISIDVERVDGNNENIATNIPLKDFLMISTFGESAIDQQTDGANTSISALCEISDNGSIELEENASIRVKMEGLKADNTYEIHGVEYPIYRTEAHRYDKKVMFEAETNRTIDVEDADIVLVTGSDAIKNVLIHYDNGEVIRRSLVELEALEYDVDPHVAVGVARNEIADTVIIPTVGVDEIEFEKSTANALNLTLLNVFELVDEDGDGEFDNV